MSEIMSSSQIELVQNKEEIKEVLQDKEDGQETVVSPSQDKLDTELPQIPQEMTLNQENKEEVKEAEKETKLVEVQQEQVEKEETQSQE